VLSNPDDLKGNFSKSDGGSYP